MRFLEKNLEDIIFENSKTREGRKALQARGLEIEGPMFRQVDIGRYGRCDLVSVSMDHVSLEYPVTFHIYELKEGAVNINALLQGMRYVQGFKHLWDSVPFKDGKIGSFNYSLTLIGSEINANDDFVYLLDELNFVQVLLYDYSLEGIRFRPFPVGWELAEPSFDPKLFDSLKRPGIGLLRKMLSLRT